MGFQNPVEKPQVSFDSRIDTAAYRRLLRRPAATGSYAVFFTARSGSSWLTDVAERSGVLGLPDECFNPRFVPRMAQTLHAGSLTAYLHALRRQRNIAGVFGCELTYHHLDAVFGGPAQFMQHFDGAKFIWLLREDIVLQAVSLMKMQQTRIPHLPQSSAAEIEAADASVRYDAAAIKRWIWHSFRAEQKTEALFAAYGIAPLRLSYEKITQLSDYDLARQLAQYIGVGPVPTFSGVSTHRKIATPRNAEFAARFRAQEAEFLRDITQTRWHWVQKVAAIDAASRGDSVSKTAVPVPCRPH